MDIKTGISVQLKKAIDNIKIGENWNNNKLAWLIKIICFPNNFLTSAKGWK
jgi:hypothetical protein